MCNYTLVVYLGTSSKWSHNLGEQMASENLVITDHLKTGLGLGRGLGLDPRIPSGPSSCYYFNPVSFKACLQRPLTLASFFSMHSSSRPSPGLIAEQNVMRSSRHSLAR